MIIQKIIESGRTLYWPSCKILKIRGKDATSFLQGQLTQDLRLCKDYYCLTLRSDLSGRYNGHCYIKEESEGYSLIFPDSNECFRNELEKFIVMEDVQIDEESKELYINFTRNLKDGNHLLFMGILGKIETIQNSPFFNEDEKKEFYNSVGFEIPEKGSLIVESLFCHWGVSTSKGCFYGQESLCKVLHRRGPSRYPVLLKVIEQNDDKTDLSLNKTFIHNGQKYFSSSLGRDDRVLGKKFTVNYNDQNFLTNVVFYPLIKMATIKEWSMECFFLGVANHLMGKNGLTFFEYALDLNPSNTDALEMKGVLLGKKGEFQKGIDVMEELESVDPDSVLALANKSLFYMNLGQIEKAEEEKAKGITKSFEKNLPKPEGREKIFEEILTIDPNDEIANSSLGEIYFESGQILKSKKHYSKALETNENSAEALLGLTKIAQVENKKDLILKYHKLGQAVATKSQNKKLIEAFSKIIV